MQRFYLDEQKSWFLHVNDYSNFKVIEGYEQCSHAARKLIVVRYNDTGHFRVLDQPCGELTYGEYARDAALRMIKRVWPRYEVSSMSFETIKGHRDVWYNHVFK